MSQLLQQLLLTKSQTSQFWKFYKEAARRWVWSRLQPQSSVSTVRSPVVTL